MLAEVILFFKASAGLKPDKINDGYAPAKTVTTIVTININKATGIFSKLTFSCIDAMFFI